MGEATERLIELARGDVKAHVKKVNGKLVPVKEHKRILQNVFDVEKNPRGMYDSKTGKPVTEVWRPKKDKEPTLAEIERENAEWMLETGKIPDAARKSPSQMKAYEDLKAEREGKKAAPDDAFVSKDKSGVSFRSRYNNAQGKQDAQKQILEAYRANIGKKVRIKQRYTGGTFGAVKYGTVKRVAGGYVYVEDEKGEEYKIPDFALMDLPARDTRKKH